MLRHREERQHFQVVRFDSKSEKQTHTFIITHIKGAELEAGSNPQGLD